MISAQALTQVEFYDVDAMNVAWHGHYVRWLELGRRELLDSLDYGYARILAEGWSFPVVDMSLRYLKPAVLGQRLRVRADLVEWENRLVVAYTIDDAADGRTLCRARSVQVAVRIGNGALSFVMPPTWLDRVNRAIAGGA